MRLLLDEMYAAAVAEQLRAPGHEVASIHDAGYRRLESEPDEEVYAAALADVCALLTENVPGFRRLEAEALARGKPRAVLVFTTNRQLPRGAPATIGRLVLALDALLRAPPEAATSIFLVPADRS